MTTPVLGVICHP